MRHGSERVNCRNPVKHSWTSLTLGYLTCFASIRCVLDIRWVPDISIEAVYLPSLGYPSSFGHLSIFGCKLCFGFLLSFRYPLRWGYLPSFGYLLCFWGPFSLWPCKCWKCWKSQNSVSRSGWPFSAMDKSNNSRGSQLYPNNIGLIMIRTMIIVFVKLGKLNHLI